ncbi:unnamed protein product [Alopecurus aequalis]
MRPTGSQESVTTRRVSKRDRSGTSAAAAATLGVTTRSRARVQQESQPAARAKTGDGDKKLVEIDGEKKSVKVDGEKKLVKVDGISRRVSPKRAKEKKMVKVDVISRRVSPKSAKEKKTVKIDGGCSKKAKLDVKIDGGCTKKAELDGGCSKKAKLDGISQPESSKKGKSILEPSHDRLSWWGEEDDDDYGSYSSSSAVSSPIRVPEPLNYRPHDPNGDSEVAKKKKEMWDAFALKIARQNTLPTRFQDLPSNCLVDDPTLLHIREPARKTVLHASQFVVGLSSSIDGVPLARCTGFWIDFDNENKTGTVVTSARLICIKHRLEDAWFCRDQYASDAKVIVELWGYKGYNKVDGNLLYCQKHYDLAFFKVKFDRSVELPSFIDKVKCGQDIFELGRDEFFDLLINHGKVEYSNPTKDERYHHMYIQGPERDRMYIGGPVIDLDGKVVGMIGSCSRGSFIPSSILLKCFHLWRNFQRIRRPHLGLKFDAISLLNPAHAEKILLECEIDEGLIVAEVSQDSRAEECGIRIGDVIECLNGKHVSTTVELENMLLSIMEKIGDDYNSDLDLELEVYFTRRDVRRLRVLSVNLSEDGDYCVPCCLTPTPRVT